MGRHKGHLSDYDMEKALRTRAILLEVFFNDRESEYSDRELHRVTGWPLSTVFKWLRSGHNDLASLTETGKWKWHKPMARDVPLTYREKQEVAQDYRENPNMKRPRAF